MVGGVLFELGRWGHLGQAVVGVVVSMLLLLAVHGGI